MASISSLLRVAQAVVQNVRNIVNQQVSLVQEAIYKQIQQMVTNVVNGMWKGDGASRFAAEMQQEVLPALHNLTQSFTNHHNSISKAEEVMFRADMTAGRMASSLVEIYKAIYNG